MSGDHARAAVAELRKLVDAIGPCDHSVGGCICGDVENLDVIEAHINSASEMLGTLKSIALYGADTLSGRLDGPDDRDWQRAGVMEMTNRARAAIAKAEPKP